MTSPSIHVLGLCGSLRRDSYNRVVLNTAGQLMPDGMRLTIGSFAELGIYDADEQQRGWPPAVEALGRAIAEADAVLIASPEYNFGVPGGLKNALDWISRLPAQPLRDKPTALLGAATGPLGTARMQYELRRILHGLEARVLLKPEVFIGSVATKIDASGQLTDETTRKFITDQMLAFRRWIVREQAAQRAADGQ